MGFQHNGRIGQHHRNRISATDAMSAQSRGKLARTGIKFPISGSGIAMHNCRFFREYRCRTFQKSQWCQGLIIGRVPVQIRIILIAQIHLYSSRHSGERFSMKARIPSSASCFIMFSTITEEVYSYACASGNSFWR